MDSSHGYDVGNRSGRIYLDHQQSPLKETLEGLSSKLSLDSTRPYWQREKARRTSSEDRR